MSGVLVRRIGAFEARELVPGLSDVLVDCVAGGASVSFLHPFGRADAERFWASVADGVARGDRALLVAQDGDGVVGTAQLLLATPPNQPHRADVAKMLVHRRGRRRGIGAALLAAIDATAADEGRTVLVLDTVTGGDAERMYLRAGWTKCGEIPNYALMPDGTPCATSVLWKALGPVRA